MKIIVNKTRIKRDLFLCYEQKLDATNSPVYLLLDILYSFVLQQVAAN
jgi:hypothetical protein